MRSGSGDITVAEAGEPSRSDRMEHWLVWLVVLYAGQANVFARSIDSWEMIASPILYLGAHLFFAWKRGLGFNRDWLIVCGAFTLHFALVTKSQNAFNPRFWGIHILMFTSAYVCLRGMGARFFQHFETVVTRLALIALLFWSVQVVAQAPLRAVLGMLEPFRSVVTEGGVNVLVYSLQDKAGSIPRNCGFAWEPGGFACFLVLAIYLNLRRTNLHWQGNRGLLVLLVALVTTQSTTGWSAAGGLLVWFVSRQKLWPIWAAIAVPVALAAMMHPMMSEKIKESMEKDDQASVEQAMDNAYQYETIYSPQRFASFRICWEDFLRHPWIGFGGNINESWGYREKIQVIVVTGLGDILRRFGTVGMVAFILLLLQSARRWGEGVPGAGFAVIVTVVVIGFSYAQVKQPAVMSFWLAGIFLPRHISLHPSVPEKNA